MVGKSGLWCLGRITSRCSTARPTKKRPASSLPTAPHDDLLARREIRLRLLVLHARDRRHIQRTAMSGARDAAVITTQATGAPTICRFSATLRLSVGSPTLRQCDDRNAVPE